MSKKYISTLEFYNYGESNRMVPAVGSFYKVKISDKEGNIITIEDDNGLYACVRLAFNNATGILSLLDVAHDESVLAEIEMPNAEYIYNCRVEESTGGTAIVFDVKSLYGNETSTIEINVDDLVELYEAGQGIEIGDKSEETGRKPISIKLVEGETILHLSDEGLGIDDSVVTDEELQAAISGKADISYVDNLINSISGSTASDIDKIMAILGTDEDDPNIQEKIDDKASLDDFNALSDEVGELDVLVNSLSGDVLNISDHVNTLDGEIGNINDDIVDINTNIDELSGKVATNTGDIEVISREIMENLTHIEKITSGLPSTVKEAYVLKNATGETLGDRIDIYKDSSIKSISYDPATQILTYVYIDADGNEQTVEVDFTSIIIDADFKDGLQVISGEVSVKIDETGEPYLTVSNNGVKLEGINDAINNVAQALSGDIDTKLDAEIARATSAETDLQTAIEALGQRISDEKAARLYNDGVLRNSINDEISRATSAETELQSLITLTEQTLDAKINQEEANRIADVDAEEARAKAIESALTNSINAEKTRAETEEQRIEDMIINEIAARTSYVDAETARAISAETELDDKIDAEAIARATKDTELENAISAIQADYATSGYVDSKVSDAIDIAVANAVASAQTYIDNELVDVENEMKQYCDSGHTELQDAISLNTTKINQITNSSGNGSLDELRAAFDDLITTLTNKGILP